MDSADLAREPVTTGSRNWIMVLHPCSLCIAVVALLTTGYIVLLLNAQKKPTPPSAVLSTRQPVSGACGLVWGGGGGASVAQLGRVTQSP
jgi:hypothetical protein